MKREVAVAIVEASDGECQLREDYSGRGMFGKTTFAVEFENMGEFMCSMVIAGKYIASDEESYNNMADSDEELTEPEITHEDFCEEIRTLSFDSMGRSGQIAY